MVISAEQERVKSLIVDTVSLLCKNGLHYSKEFAIEGLLGITLDKDDVFLVSIKEIIKSETYEGSDGDSDAKSDTRKSKRRKRKKRRANTDANESDSDVSDADNSTVADNASLHSESIEPPSKRLAVKQEEEANDDDDDDLVFIKDEPGVDLSQCSFSQVDSGAQANSVIGDLHQQGLFATPAQQQPQPHSQPWNNTPHPGGGADAFQSPTTSTSQQLGSIPVPCLPISSINQQPLPPQPPPPPPPPPMPPPPTSASYTRFISDAVVLSLRQQSTSRPNFAWRLVQVLFTADEMEGRSVHGRNGKYQLDGERMEAIKAAVLYGYPTTAGSTSEARYEWNRCETAIDRGIRSLLMYRRDYQKRKPVNQVLTPTPVTIAPAVEIKPIDSKADEQEPASSLTVPAVKTEENE